MTRRWLPRADSTTAGPLLDRVMAARGLADPADAEAFLNPSLKGLHEPSLIPDLDRAARRILDAAESGEPIVIYGDYDVDGISGTAILFRMLRTLAPSARTSTYIPHRLEEGYGINADSLDELAAQGARVVVSVDCGITAHEPADRARELGIDLIVTDHHNPPASDDDLPRAHSVVHPRRPGSGYPFGELCGAGVAYKLAWRLATMQCGSERVTDDLRALLVELLGLAALGTVADVVPLLDENRLITRYGLVRLKHSPFIGVRALVEASGLAGESIGAEDVGFRLGPRLNAAGRLGHAREALELLISEDSDRCRVIAEELTRRNDERRSVERAIVDQAAEMAEAAGMTGSDKRVVILAGEGWHPGVLGIVCSRLVEKFSRPVVLLCRDGDECKGSARSIEGFNLHGALAACAEHLTSFGGHDMAAGLRLESSKLERFADAMGAHVNSRLSPEELVRTVRYDALAEADELTPDVVRTLDALGPFGAGNPRVRLRLRGVVEQEPRSFGKTGAHAGVVIKPPSHEKTSRSAMLRLVGWNWAARLGPGSIRRGTPVEAVVEPKLNTFRGSTSVEPTLCDIRRLD